MSNEEKSSVELLEEIAKKTHREISVQEIPHPEHFMQRIRYTLRHVYMKNHGESNLYFVWKADSKAVNPKTNFCGVFFKLDDNIRSQIEVRKKSVLDKFAFLAKKSRYQTGNDNFNSKVIFSENENNDTTKILNKTKIQELAKEAFEKDERFRVGINQPVISFVPEFEDSAFIGVYLYNDWITDRKEIEDLFKMGEILERQLIIQQ